MDITTTQSLIEFDVIWGNCGFISSFYFKIKLWRGSGNPDSTFYLYVIKYTLWLLVQFSLALWKVIYGHLSFVARFSSSPVQNCALLFSPHVPRQCLRLEVKKLLEGTVFAGCEEILLLIHSAERPKTSCDLGALDFLRLKLRNDYYTVL